MQIYRPRLTHLNEKEVLRYAGQRDHQKMILGDLKKACREALLLAQPQCTWNIYDYIDLFLSFYFFLEKIQGFEKGILLQSVEMVES